MNKTSQTLKVTCLEKNLRQAEFDSLLTKVLKIPLNKGYAAHCICQRCNASYQMTASGVDRLKKMTDSGGEFKAPKEFSKAIISKYYFVLNPCFICRINGEKINSEAKLIKA